MISVLINTNINNIGLHLVIDDLSKLRLLQTEGTKYPLSSLRYGKAKPKAIMNCSYFTSEYAIGRNQGDIKNDSTSSFVDKGWLGFAIDGGWYAAGELNWWDVTNSVCGFTPATISIIDGIEVEMFTSEFASSYDAKMKLATGVSVFAITKDKKAILCTAEKGLSAYKVNDYLKKNYDLSFLCCLDGGGSSELIYDSKIIQPSTDGTERKMFNGLAFINEEDPIELMFPCEDGWGSQDFHSSDTPHYGIDIGWLGSHSSNGKTPIYAAADGEVVFEGKYAENFGKTTYYPIGVIIKHNFSKEWDYYTVYWHLSSTCIDKGTIVKKGDKIGMRGDTGYSAGVHLHFQMLKLRKGADLPTSANWKNCSVDPKPYITVYDNIQEFVYKDHTAKGVKVTYAFDLKHSKETIVEKVVEEHTCELTEKYKELEKKYEELEKAYSELEFAFNNDKEMRMIAEKAVSSLQERLNNIRRALDE